MHPDPGRCPLSFSVIRSKIKIRTSSRNKAQLALLRDEVRILIFDDPAENERGQCPEFCFAQLDSNNTMVSLIGNHQYPGPGDGQ